MSSGDPLLGDSVGRRFMLWVAAALGVATALGVGLVGCAPVLLTVPPCK